MRSATHLLALTVLLGQSVTLGFQPEGIISKQFDILAEHILGHISS